MLANPQKENGYTAICNELMEVLAKAKLNGTQFRILYCILRYTYGFQEKEHEFSLNFLAKSIDCNYCQTKRGLSDLIDKKIVKIIKEANFNSSRVLSVNKNYDEWVGVLNSIEGAKKHRGCEIVCKEGAKKPPPQGAKKDPNKEIIYKEIYKEKEKEKATSTIDKIIDFYTANDTLKETIRDFIKMRKAIKKVMTDKALELVLKKLNKLTNDENEKIEILNQSIVNSWQGVFPLKKQQQEDWRF